MISIVGELTNTTPIGIAKDITEKNQGVFTTGSTDAIEASDYRDCFTSDDPAYIVQEEGNELKLAAPVAVADVSLNHGDAVLTVGDTQTLVATIAPDNATDKTVVWSVEGADDGTVELYSDEDCTVKIGSEATDALAVYAKGIAVGTATVTVTSNADAAKSASCAVTVNLPPEPKSHSSRSRAPLASTTSWTSRCSTTRRVRGAGWYSISYV
jgi:uncharacterized protein YjdB